MLAVAAGAALSLAVYVLAVRPFRARPRGRRTADVIGWAAGGLAAGLLIRELAGLPFPQQAYALPDALGGAGRSRSAAGSRCPSAASRCWRSGSSPASRSSARWP